MIAAETQRAERERSYFERGMWTSESIGWVSTMAAERWPDRDFLVMDDERLTYGEFQRWVLALATDMVERGVTPGDRVVVQLPNCLEAVAYQVAAFRIGAVAVPVITIYREHEVRQILDSARPAMIVAAAKVRDREPVVEIDGIVESIGLDLKARYIVGGTRDGWTPSPAADAQQRPDVQLPDPAPADGLVLMLYTSGTTSAPKGAMFNSRAMFASSRMWRLGLDLNSNDVTVACAPVAHLAGFMDAFLIPTSIGGKAVVLSSWDPDEAVRIIEREKGTLSNGAPVFLLDLVERYERGAGANHRLSFFMAGGAGVPATLIRRAEAVGVASFRNYGMTETMGSVTLMSKSDSLERRGEWDGHAYEGMEVQVVDEDHAELPTGGIGEVRVRGPLLMMAYTDPVATAEQLDADGWFYPGDIGVFDDEGWLRCVGRIKDIINRGGEKFPSQDIEDLILTHPSIQQAAVTGLPDDRLGEKVGAFVTLRQGEGWVGDEAMKSYLDSVKLAKQKIPVEWHVLAEMPRTASGKIRKTELVDVPDIADQVRVP